MDSYWEMSETSRIVNVYVVQLHVQRLTVVSEHTWRLPEFVFSRTIKRIVLAPEFVDLIVLLFKLQLIFLLRRFFSLKFWHWRLFYFLFSFLPLSEREFVKARHLSLLRMSVQHFRNFWADFCIFWYWWILLTFVGMSEVWLLKLGISTGRFTLRRICLSACISSVTPWII